MTETSSDAEREARETASAPEPTAPATPLRLTEHPICCRETGFPDGADHVWCAESERCCCGEQLQDPEPSKEWGAGESWQEWAAREQRRIELRGERP